MSIIHDHNTRSKKQLSFEDAMEKMESNILEQISSLKVDVRSMKDEFLNMKDVFRQNKTLLVLSIVKKALVHWKNLINIKSEMKYNFSRNNKIFINENLTRANESIAFCGRKLKRNSKIHSCFTRDGIVFIKKTEESKAFKVHHMNVLYDAFPEFDFC